MTTIVDKIRRRIRNKQMAEGKIIEEIQITKDEARQLNNRKEIDNVKLVIEEKLEDLTNKSCFAYIDRNGHKSCYCLNKLYCKNSKCKFYRDDITITKIEKSIELYTMEKMRRNEEGV